jgi:hypothetical protein
VPGPVDPRPLWPHVQSNLAKAFNPEESMAFGNYPDNPSERKIIYVMDRQGLQSCHFMEGGQKYLTSNQAYVLVIPAEEDHPVVNTIEARGQDEPGSVLVQSPFNRNVYEDLESAKVAFAVEKQLLYSEVCRLLGARSLLVCNISDKQQGRTYGLNLDVKKLEDSVVDKVVSMLLGDVRNELIVERRELVSLLSQIVVCDKYSGGEPRGDRAQALIDANNLSADVQFTSLIRARSKKDTLNLLTARQYKLDVFSESRSQFRVAAALGVPLFIQAMMRYESSLASICEYILTLAVEF